MPGKAKLKSRTLSAILLVAGLTWGPVAFALFAGSGTAAATGSVPGNTLQFESRAAVSATTILGVTRAGCSGDQALSWVSHDRGLTWNRGACIPGNPTGDVIVLTPDAVTAQAFYWYGHQNETITLTSAGQVASRIPTGYAIPVASVGGVIFGATFPAGGVRIDANGAHPCGELPAGVSIQAASNTSVLAYGNALGAFESLDQCATFTTLPAPPEPKCSYNLYGPDSVGCFAITNNPPNYYVYDASSNSWVDSPLLDHAPCNGALSDGGRRLTCLDQFSSAVAPHTWPTAPVPAGDKTPAPYRRALNYANSRYLLPMGLPPLRWSRLLAKAAAAHERYIALNPPRTISLSLHNETPGLRGYTGRDPNQRCRHAGYSQGCGEDISSSGEPYSATVALLHLPLHADAYLSSTTLGMASGSVVGSGGFTVVEFDFTRPAVADLSVPANRSDSWLHVWPTNGTKNVPRAWYGGEIPDPLQAYRGNRFNVGPALFVHSAIPARITLRGPAGPVPLLQINAAHTAASLQADSTTLFLAGHRLAPHTTYRLTVSPPTNLDVPSATFVFETGP